MDNKEIIFSVNPMGDVEYKYTTTFGVKVDGTIYESPEHPLIYTVFETLIEYYRNVHDHQENWYPTSDYITYIKEQSYTINPKLAELVAIDPKFKLILIESALQEKYDIVFDYDLDKREKYKLPTIEFTYKTFCGASYHCECCGSHWYESKELFINEECVFNDWTDNHMSSGTDGQKVGLTLISELEKLGLADVEIKGNSPRSVLTLLDDAFTINLNDEFYGDYESYLHHAVFKYSQYILDVLFSKLVQTTFESVHEDEPEHDYDDYGYDYDYDYDAYD